MERRACSQASESRLSALSALSRAFKLTPVFPLEVTAFLHHVTGYQARLGCCKELTERAKFINWLCFLFPTKFAGSSHLKARLKSRECANLQNFTGRRSEPWRSMQRQTQDAFLTIKNLTTLCQVLPLAIQQTVITAIPLNQY